MKSIIQRLLANDDSLLNKAAVTFIVRAGSAAAAFGMNVAIARLLGVAESGVFFLSLTLVMAASIFGRFGMDNTLMRFVSSAWEKGEHACVLGLGVQGLVFASGVGLIVMGFLYLSADILAVHVFDEPALSRAMHLMSFAVLPYSLLWLLSGLLKAVQLPAQASFIEAGAVPMVVGSIMTFFLFSRTAATSEIVAGVYLGAALAAMILGLVLFLRRLPSLKKTNTVSFSVLLNSAYPLLWVDVLNFAIMWSSSLFLGIYADAESVGLYIVAQRTAALIAFILIVFNSISAPRFAALYSQGKTAELEQLAVKTASLMTLIAFPMLLAIFVFPEWILSIFGEGFTSATMLLMIIASGQFINVITGSVGYLLIMTGHERLMLNTVLCTAGLSLVMNILLVSRYGALGAAITTAMGLIIQNLVAAWFVYQRLGIFTIPGLQILRKARQACAW